MFKPLEYYLHHYDNCDSGNSVDDPFAKTVFRIQSELLGLLCRARQLRCEWVTRKILPSSSFFWKFERRIIYYIDSLNDILQKQEHTVGDFHEVFKIRKTIETWSQMFESVVGLYNERLEGYQVATIIDPVMRVSERAGNLEIMLEASERVMLAYCGFMNEYYSRKLLSRGCSPCWDGIVSTSSGQDLSIYPFYSLLRIPPSLKLNGARFLAFSHEAGHFIFYNSMYGLGSFIKCYYKYLDYLSDGLRNNGLNLAEANIVMKSKRPLELFTDIMAVLIGSPFYSILVYDHAFYPFPVPLHNDNKLLRRPLLHPMIRLKLGEVIAKKIMNLSSEWLTPFEKRTKEAIDINNKMTAMLLACGSKAADSFGHKVDSSLMSFLNKENAEDWLGDIIGTLNRYFISHYRFDCLPLFFIPSDYGNQQTRIVYQRCAEIAKYLSEGAIVYDEDIKYIVTASRMVPQRAKDITERKSHLCLTEYPTSSIYHSIIYAKQLKQEEFDVEAIAQS